jgi:hypothetical protein
MTTTTTTTTDVETAAATVAELEVLHTEAQQESTRAQAHAAALPGRLAAGDQAVSVEDLVQAGPAAAVAQAKAHAAGQKLAAAQAVLEQARAVELVAQLRAGEPFMTHDQVGKELDRISAYVLRELGKLGGRIAAHNSAFNAVAGSLPRGANQVFTVAGERLSVNHDYNGKTLELDGQQWWAMTTDGWGRDVLQRVNMAEAKARDAAAVPAPLFFSGLEWD